MGKFITFGEVMLRLAPMGYGRFLQSKEFGVVFGGGEANVAVSLANYGMDACFVTKLPTHEIGQSAVNELRKYGVDTSKIIRGGERIGIYYCEKGAAQRPSKVIYDRAHSSIAEAKREDFNWKEIFRGAEWFHITGITPALSEECAVITLEAAKAAKEAGVMVSFDLNYRSKLWTIESAQKVFLELAQYVDVCIASVYDAEKIFGIKAMETDFIEGKLSLEGQQRVIKKLADKYGFKIIATTFRENISASLNNWSAMLYNGDKFYSSRVYNMNIVDRIGGGDAFAAGLIYSLINKHSSQDTIEFSVAASCLKHSIEGDFNLVSLEEVETLMKGDASGRVQR